ncbi:hypothetical protein PC121_g9710 [Phytophthora cactorum]|nr:hypothetical protein PC121_g9710 [Phytophthora cactorum]
MQGSPPAWRAFYQLGESRRLRPCSSSPGSLLQYHCYQNLLRESSLSCKRLLSLCLSLDSTNELTGFLRVTFDAPGGISAAERCSATTGCRSGPSVDVNVTRAIEHYGTAEIKEEDASGATLAECRGGNDQGGGVLVLQLEELEMQLLWLRLLSLLAVGNR